MSILPLLLLGLLLSCGASSLIWAGLAVAGRRSMATAAHATLVLGPGLCWGALAITNLRPKSLSNFVIELAVLQILVIAALLVDGFVPPRSPDDSGRVWRWAGALGLAAAVVYLGMPVLAE